MRGGDLLSDKARGLSYGQGREAARIAKRHRATTYRHISDRGCEDPLYPEDPPWEGFDSLKLAAEILSDETLYRQASRPAYYDGSGIPANIRTLAGAVLLTRSNLGPTS